MQKNIFKGIILSSILWSGITTAQPLVIEVYNEGIEDSTTKRSGYAMHFSCAVAHSDQSVHHSMKIVASWLPPKGKGVLFEIERPFSQVEEKSWAVRYSFQVVDEDGRLPLLETVPCVTNLFEQDTLPSDKVILRSLKEYMHVTRCTLDLEGENIKRAALRRVGGGNTYYFTKPNF